MSNVKKINETEQETAIRNLVFVIAKLTGIVWLVNKLSWLEPKPQYKLRQDIYIKDRIDISDFDKAVSYVSRLETVTKSKCDRHHNKVKTTTGILPVAKLCKPCQQELKLDRQVYEL